MRHGFARLRPFLHASRSEGLRLAILEAGSLPFRSSRPRVGGVPEIIDNEVSGLLGAAALPARARAGAIEELLAGTQETRASSAPHLHERVIRDFSHDAMVEKTLTAYGR